MPVLWLPFWTCSDILSSSLMNSKSSKKSLTHKRIWARCGGETWQGGKTRVTVSHWPYTWPSDQTLECPSPWELPSLALSYPNYPPPSCLYWRRSIKVKAFRTWKQPRCPSADEWIRKLWYIYTMEYYLAVKKNSFESVLMRWMKLEPIIQSEVSQKGKEHYSILTYIWNLERW